MVPKKHVAVLHGRLYWRVRPIVPSKCSEVGGRQWDTCGPTDPRGKIGVVAATNGSTADDQRRIVAEVAVDRSMLQGQAAMQLLSLANF